jgi:hypothetical protein
MAKTTTIRAERGVQARNPGNLVETTPELSAKAQKAVNEIRKPFTSFVRNFESLAVTREQLAPKFMKAFGLWQADTGGTFVAFVRYIDPSVPADRVGYRMNRVYQAADYLRRLVGNVSKRAADPTAESQAAPVPPGDALARILAAMMSIIPEKQQNVIYEAMKAELNWSDRQIQGIQNRVEHTDPLVEIKGRTLENLRLSIPEPEAASAAA